MGNTYTVTTFHISEGTKYSAGFESLIAAIFHMWILKKKRYYGVISLEIRAKQNV